MTELPEKTRKPRNSHTIGKHDINSLMLCIAGAWLYGTISGGRPRELAKVLGRTAKDIEDLKFIEEREKEREAANAV